MAEKRKQKTKLAVLAIGGNSLIRDKDHQGVEDQFEITRETCRHIREMVALGWTVVVTHGNGPQVGFILRRSELGLKELHPVPLPSIGADTQGSIGYMIQQCLMNEFHAAGIDKPVVTVVTQVLVDREDPAFQNPSKPIGSFMEQALAEKHAAEDGWQVKEDAGRGWRRVVASPLPREILELSSIQLLVRSGAVVIAVGGGGIPVIRNAQDELEGVPAVIDKDYASALLATRLGADAFLISTAVPQVCLNYNKPNQQALPRLTLEEARRYLQAGQFPAGSMGPKIKAVAQYLEAGGTEAIITSPEYLARALQGQAGTRITLQ